MLELIIHEKNVETIKREEYVRGTVGAVCKITFDAFWADYEKTVVFKHRCNFFGKPVSIILNEMSATIDIPPEILAESGKYQIGAFGIKEDCVLPTLYSEEFNVLYGTDTKSLKLADNYTPSELEQLRLQKQDKLTAGDGIKIDKNNVISATNSVIDQIYNPESENAQSGKAVAEAIDGCVPKIQTSFGPPYHNAITVYESAETDENGLPLNKEYKHTPIDEESATPMPGWIVRRNSNGNVRTNTPIDDTDAANKRYVDDAVKNINIGDIDVDVSSKVDKIDFYKREQANDGDYGYDTGVYGVKGNNNPALFYATKAATPNTVAVRDNSGAIGVSINIKDANGNNYVGGAAPHTWVSDKLNELNQRLYDFDGNCRGAISTEAYRREQADKALEDKFKDYTPITELNLLKNVVENKKITKYTIEAGGSLTLKKNALYLFLRDGSSNTISIYNNGTLQYAGTDNELTFETGIVIIPSNTMGSSAQYPPSYYSLAIKVGSGSSLLGIPDVNSAKFSVLKEVMESGGLVAKENSGNSTVSVWEIIL